MHRATHCLAYLPTHLACSLTEVGSADLAAREIGAAGRVDRGWTPPVAHERGGGESVRSNKQVHATSLAADSLERGME